MPEMITAIGVMSGTSMDGIDVACLDTNGTTVGALSAGRTYAYPPRTRAALFALLDEPARAEHDPLVDLEHAVTSAHGDAIAAYLADEKLSASDIGVIGLHGQTVLHRPNQRLTRQLGFGQHIADRFGIETVYRFRHRDVASGGQGAPLVPVFHQALARTLKPAASDAPLMILNLGGVGNVTYVRGPDLMAFDTGPASALIDDFVRQRLGISFDAGGALAAAGQVDGAALQAFCADRYFQAPAPKSLDRQAFQRYARLVDHLSDADGAATLTAMTVESLIAGVRLVPEPPDRWLVAGGGRHNGHLMARLQDRLAVPVEPVEHVGWQGDALEAQAFGYLAARSRRGLPLSLPTTTGVPYPMPGGELCIPQS